VRLAPVDAAGEAGHVSMDDEAAAAEMTDYLISLGHRRIGFIAGPDDHPQARLREAGYRAALARSGLEPEAALMAQGSFHFDSGLRAAEALLAHSNPPTAIFASNDDMAAAVLAVAYRKGLRIPQDLSVAGFDDTPLASVVVPSLTTIYQPIREMAAQAAGMLFGKADTDPPASSVLPHRLVARQSTAAPKR
jgi:LacI family transcriptional regulator